MTDSPFSEFIRNASVEEKRRVYEDVLKFAIDRQNNVLRRWIEDQMKQVPENK